MGIIGAWVVTRDPFWMMSGALAGIISCASGLDVYFPATAFVVALVAGMILKPAATWLERRGIDDAVGAVTVHGTIGIYGMLALGIIASGYPAAYWCWRCHGQFCRAISRLNCVRADWVG